ncbi:hypothetical protein [Robertkochia sediminum]|uniref:hypothetical protein n=1 Tax=Robertkochia sediminum TaxID=2785326 RepID=UPI0019313480|nr:hypothetical protein [Robertkochia sediminum]MBL7473250.1 hypothetical protein [Robertkochia sediminum]
MMIFMLKATEGLEENKAKTDLERFEETNKNLFEILGKLKKDQDGFWWYFYVPVFAALAENNVVRPFSYYISISQGEEVLQWLKKNDEQFQQLVKLISSKKKRHLQKTIRFIHPSTGIPNLVCDKQ